MKLFLNKKLFKKIIIIFLVVNIVFNMILPNYSFAWDITGAILVKPLATFVMVATDGVNMLLQTFLGGWDYSGDFNGQFSFGKMEEVAFASPEKIFAGEYPILNANLFKASTVDNPGGWTFGPAKIWKEFTDGAGTNTISALRKAVAGIYVLLQYVAATVLLCLLIYTGIRIVLSARSPEEQARWRGYLYDWLRAVILLIFMHLIMITIFNVTDILANSLKEAMGNGQSITNILRGTIQESWGSVELITTTIMYVYTTYLTFVFVFAYFRRVLWTAILIIMAPIVAALRALGNEGRGIYQRWFREFLTNSLIQPYHIIAYYVLVMIPINIAGK